MMYYMLNMEDFGKNIKIHRENLGIKSYNFSIAANINYSYLSNIENGLKRPTLKTSVTLLNALNLTFAECMSDTRFNKKDAYKNIINASLNHLDENELKFIYEAAQILHRL